jgi:hypothetical protein
MSLGPVVTCEKCGEKIEDRPVPNLSECSPCPGCGSMVRSLHLPLEPVVHTVRSGRVTFKHKRPGKKPTEVFTGSQLRKAVGDYVNKRRVIHRENKGRMAS